MEEPSFITTPVKLFKLGELVSTGTGFFVGHKYGSKGIIFLVTNYHVITGNSPQDGKTPIGDNIEIFMHESKSHPGKVRSLLIPLYDERMIPLWIQSKDDKEADLAIIPLEIDMLKGLKEFFAINQNWSTNELKVSVSSKVSVIGYPYNFRDEVNFLPIWKTGSIASEPSTSFNGKDLIIIDISAFPGMSGAPVFANANGSYETLNGEVKFGNVKKLVGIYASMQMFNEFKYLEQINNNSNYGILQSQSLQLGHVWKASIIFELLNNFNVNQYEKLHNKKLMVNLF